MNEEIRVDSVSKKEMYEEILPQIKALVYGEGDIISNMANMSAALKQVFGFFWVGFYRVIDDKLVLGPYQGSIACTHIEYGKGVCGTCWKEKKTIIVPDVDQFPSHIACSSLSKSEIVVPIISDGEVKAVLDIDSDNLDSFNELDSYYLNILVGYLKF
ncbi:MAG: GAF domain-containing protein [Dysgonamonadaceae bacterium]|jgi:GAF domain-containing protein|nr:GAF domain-containing protein [Dysgonamonadaceae bacterium]MEA5080144.1 GAF domain-containing protein [Dysgonamonadaceae bacterium]